MEQIDRDNYRLSSGRTFYAHGGIIGIGPKNVDDARICHGWDGTVDIEPYYGDESAWTPEEKRELAVFIIQCWAEWAGLSGMDTAIKTVR